MIRARGHRVRPGEGDAAGILLGLFAGGSAVGGLIFGALQVPGRARFQVIAIAAILVALSSAVGLTGYAVWMTVFVVAAGAFFSPVMIVAYFAAHDFGGDHRKTESTTWVNTSHNIGAAAGSALAGRPLTGADPLILERPPFGAPDRHPPVQR